VVEEELVGVAKAWWRSSSGSRRPGGGARRGREGLVEDLVGVVKAWWRKTSSESRRSGGGGARRGRSSPGVAVVDAALAPGDGGESEGGGQNERD